MQVSENQDLMVDEIGLSEAWIGNFGAHIENSGALQWSEKDEQLSILTPDQVVSESKCIFAQISTKSFILTSSNVPKPPPNIKFAERSSFWQFLGSGWGHAGLI